MSWWLLLVIFAVGLLATQTLLVARSFAPWVPTRKEDLSRILALIPQSATIYELGAGTAVVSRYIAKYRGGRIIAVEKSLLLYLVAQFRRLISGQRRAYVVRLADLYSVNVSDADCVYVFGMPDKLEHAFCKKVLAECKVGTKVVSYCFAVRGLTQTNMDQPSPDRFPIFEYTL